MASISVTKKHYNITLTDCSVIDIGTDILWNSSTLSGLPNYANCFCSFIIPPNTEYIGTYESGDIEYPADAIKLYFDGIPFPPIIWNLNDISVYPNRNNVERNVTWEFVSDGSWNSQGFSVTFKKRGKNCFYFKKIFIFNF